jgi:hypothetical protein
VEGEEGVRLRQLPEQGQLLFRQLLLVVVPLDLPDVEEAAVAANEVEASGVGEEAGVVEERLARLWSNVPRQLVVVKKWSSDHLQQLQFSANRRLVVVKK